MQIPGIELLEVLIAAGESRSLSEAAARLKISQPAVSVKLKELERQAPLPLFSYEGKRKVLTHYGQELYRIAKARQVEMAAAYEALNRRYAEPERLTLRIGCRPELFESLEHRFRFPGRVEFIAMPSREAVEQLLAQKVDIAVSYPPVMPDSTEIMAKKVLESASQLVVPKKFLRKKLSAALAEDVKFLTETPCVTYEGGGHSISKWTAHLGIPFERLKVAAVAEDWRTLRKLIEAGWGYGIVPGHLDALGANTSSVEIVNSVLPKYSFYALFRKSLRKIPAFRELLEFR